MINPIQIKEGGTRLNSFQFHIGMINPRKGFAFLKRALKFQFHIGMINPDGSKYDRYNLRISIPHWYD